MSSEELNPEQRKQVVKILFKARANLFFIGLKFSIGLFSANLVCLVFGQYFLKDCNPSMISGFNFVSMLANLSFMVIYLYAQLKINSDNVADKIKEVLKNHNNTKEM